MSAGCETVRATQTLFWLVLLYAAASLLHFGHNAEYLAQYPNLPASWSRADVYAAWCCISGLGLAGYTLYRFGYPRIGLGFLGSYAALGFDGLLHYTRAPLAHHSAMMNSTIWMEVVAAALLLVQVARLAHQYARPQQRPLVKPGERGCRR
jgi:hypothetical protein